MGRFDECVRVTPDCPVTSTTLGYYPNAGINAFFAAGFGIAALVAFFTGCWKKTWAYMAFLTAGSVLELAGYAARVPLHSNPWNKQAFETQICAIILAPTLICISIYLTLKHVCQNINPALSRVRPRLYPLIFVPADVSCLLVQAIGGALAASAGSNPETADQKLLDGGNRAIIAGICLQVAVLAFFGVAGADYLVRVRKWVRSSEVTPEAAALWGNRKFKMFLYAVTAAYILILIRCIYRVAEMAGGWGNRIMQDEPSFIVLEGFTVWIACMLLACFPPGFLFPQMLTTKAKLREERALEKQQQREDKHARKARKKAGAGGSASDDTAVNTDLDVEEQAVTSEEKSAGERV